MQTDSALISPPAAKPCCAPATARTPLHAFHLRHGAKMVPFAGYEMPLQYPAGLLKEHLHTRAATGLFDVSHMGQMSVVPHSGDMAAAALALEQLIPVDLLGLKPGRQRYGLLTSAAGGIHDDLMVANLGERWLIVVNAACKTADEAHLRAELSETCEIRVENRALLALQGPGADAALSRFAPEVGSLRFMDAREVTLLGCTAVVTRSGYTGEDGFEISLPEDRAEEVAEALLSDPGVLPIGLGARDSLRLEAGLCLYGADIDDTTSPVEAGLLWAIQPVRRPGGARVGGFAGADRILAEIASGAVRRRTLLKPEGRTPVRGGAALFAAEDDAEPVGRVTSGGFGPSVGAPVAMGYLPTALAAPGARVFAEVRGQRLPVTAVAGPFVPPGFKRS